MSYDTLAAILSFVYGLAGMIFIVYFTTKARNPRVHLAGCVAFWLVAALLALSTTYWASTAWTVVGIAFAIAIEADMLADSLATWGRLCEQISDNPRVFDSRWFELFHQTGIFLRGCQPRLSGRSLVGWCVQRVIRAWTKRAVPPPQRRHT